MLTKIAFAATAIVFCLWLLAQPAPLKIVFGLLVGVFLGLMLAKMLLDSARDMEI